MDAIRNNLSVSLVSLGIYSKPVADQYVASLDQEALSGLAASMSAGANIKKSNGTIVVVRTANS